MKASRIIVMAIFSVAVLTSCKKEEYTVSFESNGGSPVASQTVKEGEKITLPQVPERNGYIFEAWYKETALTNEWKFDTDVVKSDITLYAGWSESVKEYTVSFESNGGSPVASQTVKEGEKVMEPEPPTLDGYTFDGWYKDSNLTQKYDFAATVTADLTLYAKWNEDITPDGITWKITSNGTLIISGKGEMAPYNSMDYYPWKEHWTVITDVVIEEGVTSIGNVAFSSMSRIMFITIPNSVTSIGSSAFDFCTGLMSVTVPNSVTSIGDGAFYNCESLTSVTIGNSVTEIGNNAFAFCRSLTSVTIPASVTFIGDGAFFFCLGLSSINVDATNNAYSSENGVLFNKTKTTLIQYPANKTDASYIIPGSVTSIENAAFAFCIGLTSVSIPGSVISIGNTAFRRCDGLVSVTIPNSVTSIEAYTFYDCNGLTYVIIGNSVTTIGAYAFGGCKSLKELTIPNSVTTIEDGAFSFCSSLEKLIIPNSVTSIGSFAFDSCIALKELIIPNSITTIRTSTFGHCSSLTKLTIPNSVTSIESSAFTACYSLEELNLGNSVTSIGEGAFSYCNSLKELIIPNSVTSIGDFAFGYTGLKEITMGNSVTSFGSIVFANTPWYDNQPDGLIYIDKILYQYKGTMPANTTVIVQEGTTVIARTAFYDCSGLTSVTLPNSVTHICGMAFYYCSGLTEIISHATNPPKTEIIWGWRGAVFYVFHNVNKTACTVRVPAASVAAYRAAEDWKDFADIVAIE